jgi:hypothetical protein
MTQDGLPAHVRRVLTKLQGVRPTHDGWDALCPCPGHGSDGDQSPSLRAALGDDGRVLLCCRVGCQTDAVLEALGLDWGDLFADSDADGQGSGGPAAPAGSPRPERADADLCDRTYRLLLEQLPLAEEHRQDLRRRGLADPEIDLRTYRSLRNVDRGRAARAVHAQLGDDVLAVPGFIRGDHGVTLQGEATGLLVPVRDLQGRIVALKIRRATEPKYLYLTGGADGPSPSSPAHVPLKVTAPALVVRVTEGELKADVCTALDETPTIGVPGVTQWRGAVPVLRALGARTVVVAFDAADVRDKPPVFEQAEALWQGLKTEGFAVEVEDWDEPAQGS